MPEHPPGEWPPRHHEPPPTATPGPEEQQLLGELAAAVAAHDPVPSALVERARELFTWRTVDAELATLVSDSLDPGGVLVRGPAATVRLLAFSGRRLSLELEVLDDGGTRRVVGAIDPPAPARVTVEHPGGSHAEDADELGRFLVERVPGGLVRVRVALLTGAPLVTPWFRV